MKSIEDIIYDTTREVLHLEDKLRIATIFLFCQQQGNERLSQLLYCEDHESFISDISDEYSAYEVDFSINLKDKNVKNAFSKTLKKVKEEWDPSGFLKALHEGDEFAIVIHEMTKGVSDIFYASLDLSRLMEMLTRR
jgi:hypothetical protein